MVSNLKKKLYILYMLSREERLEPSIIGFEIESLQNEAILFNKSHCWEIIEFKPITYECKLHVLTMIF